MSPRSTADTTHPEWGRLLRSRGLRVTAPRVAVLQAFAGRRHLDAGQTASLVESQIGPTATQTVYDALTVLTAAGLLRRIEPAGSPMRYERQDGDNHHHLVCRRCHAIVDIACVVGAAPCLTPVSDHGYVVDEAEIVFWGLCPDCQAAPGTPNQLEPGPTRLTTTDQPIDPTRRT